MFIYKLTCNIQYNESLYTDDDKLCNEIKFKKNALANV